MPERCQNLDASEVFVNAEFASTSAPSTGKSKEKFAAEKNFFQFVGVQTYWPWELI